MMFADVVEQALVSVRLCHCELFVRGGDLRGLEKIGAAAPKHELRDRIVRTDRDVCLPFAHMRFDCWRTECARHRDAVVAVEHEECLADFEQLDRWKSSETESLIVDLLPAPSERFGSWQERPVELALPAERSDDAIDRDLLR